jgi:hypothetical protein
MATRFEVWKQATLDIERGIAELDQARASLKDIQLQDLQALGYEDRKLGEIILQADRLAKELRVAACDECFHAIAKHGSPAGCDASVALVDAPCGCRWGLEEAGPRS